MINNIHEKEIIIRPPSGLAHLNVRELIKYRHMLRSMVWRDIRMQFDNMYLGFFWAVARPLAMVAIFTFLKRAANANMFVTISYPLYVYSGIILWFYFLEATTGASRSVLKDAGLIKKVYYPRMITPLVPTISGLYTLCIAIIPLIIMMIWLGVYPGWRIIFLPAILLQCILLSLGVGIIFASLSLTNNDFGKFLNLILYIGLFISPVIFAPEIISARAQIIFFLNPIAGTLLAFRSCLLHNFHFPFWQFIYSCCFTILLLIVGTVMFRRAEIYFADKL